MTSNTKLLTTKILEHQIIDLKKPFISYTEKAQIIKQYCDNTGISPKQMALKFGLDPKEIYRYLQALKFTSTTRKLIKQGQISETTAARTIYSLKPDEHQTKGKKGLYGTMPKKLSKKEIDKAINTIASENMSQKQAEKYIAQLNDPKKELEHYNLTIKRFNNYLVTTKVPTSKNYWDTIKEIKRTINISQTIVKKIE